MNDVQNNLAFLGHVISNSLFYTVIESEDKLVGIIFDGAHESLSRHNIASINDDPL